MQDDLAPGRDPRPLFSMEAEQAVIGSILLTNDAYDRVVGLVSADDFYTDDHRRLWRAISEIIAQRKQADVVTVSEDLRATGDLERVGGMKYVHELVATTPSSANVQRYAEIVHDRAIIRRVLSALSRLAGVAQEANGYTGAQLLDQAQKAFGEIGTAGHMARGELRPISDFMTTALEKLDDAAREHREQGLAGVSTGFQDLDARIGGMKAGQLIVIAGRPGMGKSAMALNIVSHCALKWKLATGYFSMEMEGDELVVRQLADLANLHGLRVTHGRISQQEWTNIGTAAPTLSAAPIFLCEDANLSITEISAGARRMAREAKGRLGPIVVDYLGLMRTERQTSNRAQDLAEISRGLKALAKELKVPVLLLAQLNRECEKRGDKRPILSDLRDSGEIEADADKVLMLYRDEVYHEDRDDNKGRAEVLIRKQRNGPTGRVILRYDGARTRFSDWTEVAV